VYHYAAGKADWLAADLPFEGTAKLAGEFTRRGVAGMWERRDGGYLIVADDMVRAAINFRERTASQEAECARRGKHLPADGGSESGWVICGHCGIPLNRPDGGPVALPHGGPLGPDTRQKDS